jgi:hypothetical protein
VTNGEEGARWTADNPALGTERDIAERELDAGLDNFSFGVDATAIVIA